MNGRSFVPALKSVTELAFFNNSSFTCTNSLITIKTLIHIFVFTILNVLLHRFENHCIDIDSVVFIIHNIHKTRLS